MPSSPVTDAKIEGAHVFNLGGVKASTREFTAKCGNRSMGHDDGPILVTGAAGCIGAWVVARLAGAGRPVVALDRADDRRRLLLAMDENAVSSIPWETADITREGTLADAVRRHRARAIIRTSPHF